MQPFGIFSARWMLVFLLAVIPAAAGPIVVTDYGARHDGQTDDTPAIQAAIDAAGRLGPGTTVQFPAGHYRLGAGRRLGRTHLAIKGLHGIALVGEPGVLLDSSDPTCAFFRIEDSTDITVTAFQLDRHPFVFTQGRVGAVSEANRTIDLTIDPGYDELDAPYIRPLDFLMIFTDPTSGTWDHDAPWPPRIVQRESLGAGRWRVTVDRAPLARYAGQPFVLWSNHYGGSAFSMDRSANVAVEQVAYYGGGADAGFFISHCEGRISFHHFSVAPPAGSGRRFSASGGAMVFNNRIQLVVDDCDFEATDDDGINMGGNSSHLLSQLDPRTVRIEGGRGDYRAGDLVALWDWSDKHERLQARVVRAERRDRDLVVTLDRDVKIERMGVGPWAEFSAKHIDTKTHDGREAMHAARRANEIDGIDRIIDLDDVGTEVVRNSRFQSFRARNLLIKAREAVIENNVFHDTAMAAILAGPEFYWDEGPAVQRLTIRHNRFENVSGSSIFVGSHHSEASRDNREITIEDNVFVGFGRFQNGVSGRQGTPIYIRNATGVTISGNRFETPDRRSPAVPRVLVEASDRVVQSDNRVVDLPPSVIPDDLEARHDVLIGYGGSSALHAELIQTKTASQRLGKAIIYVHGGGWVSGTNEYDIIRLFYLARQGYLLVSVEYRLSGEAKWPAQLQDCRLAVRWLRANAARFQIDPDHIGVYGHSAGGHLVAALGTMEDSPGPGEGAYPGISSRVQAVVDASGPVDFVADHFYAGSFFIPREQQIKDRGMLETLLGSDYEHDPAGYADASPINHVSASAPPFFIVNGEKDAIVSPRQAGQFVDKLRAAGVPVKQLLIRNGIHGLGPVPGGPPTEPSAAAFQSQVIAFYAQYLR